MRPQGLQGFHSGIIWELQFWNSALCCMVDKNLSLHTVARSGSKECWTDRGARDRVWDIVIGHIRQALCQAAHGSPGLPKDWSEGKPLQARVQSLLSATLMHRLFWILRLHSSMQDELLHGSSRSNSRLAWSSA